LFTVLAVVTVALFVIDIRHHRLPHRIVLPSMGIVAALAIAAWFAEERATWATALIGVVAMGGFYGLFWLIYPKGMGFGDVTTACLLGFAAGFLGLQELAVAAIAGPLVGGVIVLMLAATRRLRRGLAIPYGPALISGAWIGILWGAGIAHAYLRAVGLA
jgi:leader peptidase (prepilin peptidase)/N-methyltransferase